MLGEPVNANFVPGSGTLRAVVRSNMEHHPKLYIEDCATKFSRLLLDQWATGLEWSPDGKWIACNVYESRERPSNLGLVEMVSERSLRPELPGRLEEYKWSPDSGWLSSSRTQWVDSPFSGSSRARRARFSR